jgi:hypothetical protein
MQVKFSIFFHHGGPFVATGLPEVDIIGGICGYLIANTNPKSFFNAVSEFTISFEQLHL